MPIKEPPPLQLTAEEPDDNNRNRFIDELMTVAQATQFLGYKDVHVVLNLLNSRELKGHRIGKKWLIWKSDLIAYINRH